MTDRAIKEVGLIIIVSMEIVRLDNLEIRWRVREMNPRYFIFLSNSPTLGLK